MRTIIIPNCECETYEKIRDILYDEIPYAIINDPRIIWKKGNLGDNGIN